MDWSAALVGAILGALVPGTWRIATSLVHYLRHGRRRVSIARHWSTRWSYDGPEADSSNDRISVHRIGPWIWGRGTGTDEDYAFRGRLTPDAQIIGTWRSLKKGRRWGGTFMVQINVAGDLAEGYWLGTLGRAPGVKAGPWVWTTGESPHLWVK